MRLHDRARRRARDRALPAPLVQAWAACPRFLRLALLAPVGRRPLADAAARDDGPSRARRSRCVRLALDRGYVGSTLELC